MGRHTLEKVETGWQCSICGFQRERKPTTAVCPGVTWYDEKPFGLFTKAELKRHNLQPPDSPAGVIKSGTQWVYLYDPKQAERLHPYPVVTNDTKDVDWLTKGALVAYNLSTDGVTPVAILWGWIESREDWLFLYDKKVCPPLHVNLPPIYPWNNREGLFTAKQLQRFNLSPGNAKPQGCSWADWQNNWVWLYDRHDPDLEILDPSLPHCYHQAAIPSGLGTKYGLQASYNLKPKPDAVPRGCYRVFEKLDKYYGEWRTIFLYHVDDCEAADLEQLRRQEKKRQEAAEQERYREERKQRLLTMIAQQNAAERERLAALEAERVRLASMESWEIALEGLEKLGLEYDKKRQALKA